MKSNTLESLIGALVIVIAIIFTSMAYKVSGNKQKMASGYVLLAEFNNIDGINIGSDIKISGVKVGSVIDIKLNDNYKADIKLKFPNDVLIPTDSVFKVSTSGLIGAKFINLKVGANEEYLKNGDKVDFTESTMDLEDLIGRFIFNNENKNEKNN